MSHIRVKTTYNVQGPYASTEVVELYCDHNLSIDCTTFYDSGGCVKDMIFNEWDGTNLWDAMNKLMFPFKDRTSTELEEGVEYYFIPPWKEGVETTKK